MNKAIGVQKYFPYFWRLTGWIVGPLFESTLSGSGFFYWIDAIEIGRRGSNQFSLVKNPRRLPEAVPISEALSLVWDKSPISEWFALYFFEKKREEVSKMEDNKEGNVSIWVWVIIVGVAALLIVGFITFLKP